MLGTFKNHTLLQALFIIFLISVLSQTSFAHWCDDIYMTYARIIVKPERQNIDIETGSTGELKVRVRNNFPYGLRYFLLRVNPPSELSVTVSPSESEARQRMVYAGEEITFTLSITRNSSGTNDITSLNIEINTAVEDLNGWMDKDDWWINQNYNENDIRNSINNEPWQTRALLNADLADINGCSECEKDGIESLIELWEDRVDNCTTRNFDSQWPMQFMRAGHQLAVRLRFNESTNPNRNTIVQSMIKAMDNPYALARGFAAFLAAYSGNDNGVIERIEAMVNTDGPASNCSFSADNDAKIMAKSALLILGKNEYHTDITNCVNGSYHNRAKMACAAALGIMGEDNSVINFLMPRTSRGTGTSYENLFGAYLLQLVVFSRRGGPEGSGIVSFLDEDANLPPSATAAADYTSGAAPLTVNFTGTGNDEDGIIANYYWDFGDNTGNSSLQNPSYTFNNPGTYNVSFTVTDNGGASNSDHIEIQVNQGANIPPTALAAANPTTGLAPLTVNFTGTGNDEDGTITSYNWDFGDNSGTSSEQNPEHTFNNTGTFTVRLTVTDNRGATGENTVAIQVGENANVPPTAIIVANHTSGSVPLTINFTGNGTDEDGTIDSYYWDFGDNSGSSTEQNPTYTYDSVGSFTVRLTVTDNENATGENTISILVNEKSNTAPIAKIEASPTFGILPLTVEFKGNGTDEDGTITAYKWDFGDRIGSSDEQNPSYIYNSLGTFTAILTVTDDKGANGKDTVVINVTTEDNLKPVAEAQASTLSGSAPLTVNFTGNGTDEDGSIVAFYWEFGDDKGTSQDQNPSYVYEIAGTYTVTLTVTDNLSAIGTTQLEIKVLEGDVDGNGTAQGCACSILSD